MVYVETLAPGHFTLADLETLPDDENRYELVDGMLLVSPGPLAIHQTAVVELTYVLRHHCPGDLKVLVAPMDYQPTPTRSLQPDVLVCRREDVGHKTIEKPLLLAVEVLSQSMSLADRVLKRRLYEQGGVAAYWMFDPAEEELTVLELEGETYVERAVVTGKEAFEAELPFPVRIVPADLVV
ncbi:Uma2 family endonuclease [Kribbella shirazensis]|uniref:Uma2 family endonuclease n=1 Tax=Kribbella shirazensis TaxID=1105143 RepID=A0A7X5VAN3_9ACTN|nr:Uma2 family endonuclease [Kribbella shirazensis]NIK57301.1 Uma2 family endonuclease [Kribbella shirazensis]